MQFLREPGDVVVHTEPGNVAADTEPSDVVVDTEPANMEVHTAESLKEINYSIASLKKKFKYCYFIYSNLILFFTFFQIEKD